MGTKPYRCANALVEMMLTEVAAWCGRKPLRHARLHEPVDLVTFDERIKSVGLPAHDDFGHDLLESVDGSSVSLHADHDSLQFPSIDGRSDHHTQVPVRIGE